MKIIQPLFVAASILLSATAFATDEQQHQSGEKLFKTYCIVCHGAKVGGMDMNKRIAPPIAAVRMHYIDRYPDQASFVTAISGWLEKQDESKSLMRGAINKFKIMPPIVVPKADAKKIANYLYAGKIEEPKGFRQHVEDEHGKAGCEKKHQMGKGEHNPEMHHQMQGMGGGMRGNGQRGGMRKMMHQLNLSPEQQQQMRQLMHQKKGNMRPLKMQIQQINQAIHQLDTARSDDKTQRASLEAKKASLVAQRVKIKKEMRGKIEAFLTPEQLVKFKQMGK